MGTGASKGSGPKSGNSKNLESDDDDFSPPPTLSRKKNHALQSANQLPKLPETFDTSVKDVQRTIIGLDDSDEEYSNTHNKAKVRDAGDDKKLEHKLKRDIVDLENTLTDLETSDDLRRNDRKFHRPIGTLTRSASIDIRDDDQNYFNISQTSGSRKLPPTAQRRASYGVGAKGSRQYPRHVNMSNRYASSIKFSWQEESIVPDKDNAEEWTYKQVLGDIIILLNIMETVILCRHTIFA